MPICHYRPFRTAHFTYFGEVDATVNKKVKAALAVSLTPIVCVGETLAENEAGQTSTVVSRQVRLDLQDLTPEQALKLIIAYEPLWLSVPGGPATAAGRKWRPCRHYPSFIGGIIW